MAAHLEIDTTALNDSFAPRILELRVDALFFSPEQRGYKSILSIFPTGRFSEDWRPEPIPNLSGALPDARLLSDNGYYALSYHKMNLTFFHPETLEGPDGHAAWFLRENASHLCTIYYHHEEGFVRGTREMLAAQGARIRP